MINKTQNTNFGTKFFISPQAFNHKQYFRLVGLGKGVEPSFSIREPDAKFLKGEGISLGAVVCTMGILRPKNAEPGSEFFFCHVIPGTWRQDIKNGLMLAQERLKKPCSELKALIVGAEARDEYSMKNADYFMNTFEKEGIEYSALIGQKDDAPYTHMHYSLAEDVATFDFRGAKNVKSGQDLGKAYSAIKFAQGDDFVFGRGVSNDK